MQFGGQRGQRLVGRLRRAVDDEGGARQRLEGGGDRAIGVEIMCPGGAAAQGQHRVVHGKRFVAAQSEFGARRGHILRLIGQCKGIGAGDYRFGIGGKAGQGYLRRGVRRQAEAAEPWCDIAIAAFDTARETVGDKARAQLVDALDRYAAIRRDVMPPIGRGRADIGGAGRVLDECAGLEQVGSPAAAGGDAEAGAAAGQRKACDRRR